MLSSIGLYSATLSSAAFQLLGMADLGLLPRVFALRAPIFNTPWVSIVVTSLITLGMSFLSFNNIAKGGRSWSAPHQHSSPHSKGWGRASGRIKVGIGEHKVGICLDQALQSLMEIETMIACAEEGGQAIQGAVLHTVETLACRSHLGPARVSW